MNEWAKVFSGPADGNHHDVLRTIATTWAGSVTTHAIERLGDRIASRSSGLLQYLSEWQSATADLDTVWNPAFGRADLAINGRRIDAADVATRVGLQLATAGECGVWTATVPPTVMTVAGHAIANVVSVEVEITASSGRITLQHGEGGETVLARGDDGNWSAEPDAPRATRLSEFIVARPIGLLSRSMLPADVGSRDILADCLPVELVSQDTIGVFQAGSDMIADLVPHYLPWISSLVRGVVVCEREASFHLTSGSWEDVPGYVHMSSPHIAIDMADTLIHEASHQYFYLLQRVGPFDDGTDPELYYSPATRTKRPVSRLLMALHAFVNVLELYEAVLARTTRDVGYVTANLPTLRNDIATLDAPLRGNPALTTLGQAMHDPLVTRLDALAPRLDALSA